MVAGAARLETEIFEPRKALEQRGSGGGREQHGLRRRALMFFGELEGEEHVSPS